MIAVDAFFAASAMLAPEFDAALAIAAASASTVGDTPHRSPVVVACLVLAAPAAQATCAAMHSAASCLRHLS